MLCVAWADLDELRDRIDDAGTLMHAACVSSAIWYARWRRELTRDASRRTPTRSPQAWRGDYRGWQGGRGPAGWVLCPRQATGCR